MIGILIEWMKLLSDLNKDLTLWTYSGIPKKKNVWSLGKD